MSASLAKVPEKVSENRNVLVWDVPVRLFHWLMVASFAGAWFTAENESLRLLHVTLGYTMGGLVAFRVLWGLVGSRYARFSNFVRGPRVVVRHIREMLRGHPEHHTGHNPLGALAIVALLLLALAVTASGWGSYSDVGGKWLEETHEAVSGIMLTIVFFHIAGVLFSSWLQGENLIGAMFTGRKPGVAEDAIGKPRRSAAVVLFAIVAAFWWLQWQNAPDGSGLADFSAASVSIRHHAHDDD